MRNPNGYRHRTVPFGEKLRKSLDRYKDSYDGRLFKLQPNSVSQIVMRLAKRAGVTLTQNMLRHW